MPDKPTWEEFAGAGSTEQKDATDIYDGRYGKYKDAVADDPDTDGKLPSPSLPKAPEPSPFKVGPLGK